MKKIIVKVWKKENGKETNLSSKIKTTKSEKRH